MNILFLTAMEVNPQMGGVQRVTDLLGRYFVSRRHSVFFLASCNGEAHVSPEGIKHLFIQNINKENLFPSKSILKEIVKNQKIDVIINQTGPTPIFTELLLSGEKVGPKIITVVHGSVLLFLKGYERTISGIYGEGFFARILKTSFVKHIVIQRHIKKYSKVYREILNLGDALVLLTNDLLKELSVYYEKFPAEKVHIIPNPSGYKTRQEQVYSKEKVVVYVGRLENDPKRCDLLLRIWEMVFKEMQGWNLIFVGDGSSRSQLTEYVREHDLERVTFKGYQDPVEYYEKASIICLTSIHEGFPMVLPEAMSFEVVPVVFNSFAAATEIIQNNQNGFLVKNNDLSGYAEVLISLMRDDLLRERLGKCAKQSVEKYSIQSVGDRWLSMLESI